MSDTPDTPHVVYFDKYGLQDLIRAAWRNHGELYAARWLAEEILKQPKAFLHLFLEPVPEEEGAAATRTENARLRALVEKAAVWLERADAPSSAINLRTELALASRVPLSEGPKEQP